MNNKKIATEVRKILNEDKDKFLYRNLGSIADKIGISKTSVLRAVTTCKDIEIVFNEENYNPNSGPLFALRDNIKDKAKEVRILIEQEKQKEKEKSKKKKIKKSTGYKQPKQTATQINRRRIKNCTKKFIAIHNNLDQVLNKYSISLSKNDQEFMDRAVNIMGEFTSLIQDIIEKNDYTEYELEDKK